jgi:hypothetical protein
MAESFMLANMVPRNSVNIRSPCSRVGAAFRAFRELDDPRRIPRNSRTGKRLKRLRYSALWKEGAQYPAVHVLCVKREFTGAPWERG